VKECILVHFGQKNRPISNFLTSSVNPLQKHLMLVVTLSAENGFDAFWG